MDELSVRERFLAVAREAKPVYEPIDVLPFGRIYVKKLSVGERDKFDPLLNGPTGNRVACLLYCCFDERGIRIFEPDEADLIRQLDPAIADQIVAKAMTLNGLREDASDAAAKNSNGQGDRPS